MLKTGHKAVAAARNQWMTSRDGVDAHRHDAHELIYAGSGVVGVSTPAGWWVAPHTGAIWVPAGCLHAHPEPHGAADVSLLGVPAAADPLHLDSPAVLTVGPLLRQLIIACSSEPDDGSPERHRLRAVLLDRLRLCSQQPIRLPTPTDPLVRTACDLLRRNRADNRTLAELGQQIGAGESTLGRRFRDDLGMTFIQWRTQLRLDHALHLLTDDVPVTEVANRCGWSSASTLITAFHRAFGETPGTYRRR